MKLKEFGPPGGCASKTYYVDPPLHYLQQKIKGIFAPDEGNNAFSAKLIDSRAGLDSMTKIEKLSQCHQY